MSKVSWSLKSFKFGPVPDDGTMGEVLADIGPISKDTATLTESDPTVTEAYAEQYDDAIDSFGTKGAKGIKLSLMDMTPETLQSVFGGDIVDGMWEEPEGFQNIERSVQMITKSDILLEFPRTKFSAVINGDLKTGTPLLVPVTVSILKPTGPGVKARRIGAYLAPVVNAGNPANTTVGVGTTNLVGTATPFRGTITKMLWTVDTKPAGATPALATPAALACAVSGLTVAGTYKLKLAVSDSNDYEASALVTITVTA